MRNFLSWLFLGVAVVLLYYVAGLDPRMEPRGPLGLSPSPSATAVKDPPRKPARTSSEGPWISAVIEAGPFDLHRRYRSMEGPYINETFSFEHLLSAPDGVTVVPEYKVNFVEGGSGSAPMSAAPASSQAESQASPGPRALYWVKGLRVEVVDEKGEVLPTAEFICHTNVDVNLPFRTKTFPIGERCQTTRVFTVTQGQTEILFPEGFGVPVSSDEEWTYVLQAANRTTDQHRRVKHRCTLYLIKDSELLRPMTALTWAVPYISVVVDHNTPQAVQAEHANLPCCLPSLPGVHAPNASPQSVFTDNLGRRISGHFVVPPGRHSYHSPISAELVGNFANHDKMIQLVWSHIHPLCTECSIVRCEDGKTVVQAKAKTKTAGGLQLENIELISSEAGIPLKAGAHYEIEATYDNSTPQAVDSMVSMGVFFADPTFARPKDLLNNQGQNVFCNVPQRPAEGPPLFDPAKDAPPLEGPQDLEVETNAGKLHFQLEPALAPRHAAQLYKLLTEGVFDATPFVRYEPGFVLQLATADRKVEGRTFSEAQKGRLRRLPLEVESQLRGEIRHRKWVLTMARDEGANSAVSSFSILLADQAPHLDRKYTIFGHMVADPESVATVKNITDNYKESKFYIRKVTPIKL